MTKLGRFQVYNNNNNNNYNDSNNVPRNETEMLSIGYKMVNNDGESFQVSGGPSCGIQNYNLGLKMFQG